MSKIFFVGIGGIGVSSLAQYYLARGDTVAGSDAEANETTELLRSHGVIITSEQDIAGVQDADLVIHTTAAAASHPQLARARSLGITIQTYPENLGGLTRRYTTVAIAGAHGKSTTTAMLALIMIAAGLDPTVIIGTRLHEFDDTNFRAGHSRFLVVEADEYKGAFWHYRSQIAVILNIDVEHLDFYQDLGDIKASFARFINNVAPGGTVIVNGQNDNAVSVARAAVGADRRLVEFNRDAVAHHDLQIPGLHNQVDAEAAAQAALSLGIAPELIEQSLHQFKNTWRRLELVAPGIYSDYGHHPVEIAAALQAARELYPDRKIIAVLQPFQRDRLNRLFDKYLRCVDGADEAYVVPTYVVRGRDVDSGLDSRDLVTAINRPNVHYSDSVEAAYAASRSEVGQGAVAVYLGNGDIDARLRQLIHPSQHHPVI